MTAFDFSPSLAAPVDDAPPPPAERVRADWVFGYGSLIWDPGFEYVESGLGQVHGYHRAFCIRSTRYRGTPEQPGVVLGLDRGGSCIGMAFRLREASRERAVEALYEREMTGGVYVARTLSVVLADGRRVQALAFVANRDSRDYQRLTDAEIVARLSTCCGQRGRNREYAVRTWHSLAAHGVHCPHLARVGRQLERIDCA
ncbi:MAG TPA: gamma-glutamylcyclotransferase [Burkholderiaceae bacterium]|nr:gamma-glutamylcyclotransferase [Burkholderiaceae bacterium]